MNDKMLFDTIARRLEAARNLDKAFADAGVSYAQYFNAGCALKDHYLPLGIPVFRIESQPRLAVALRCVAPTLSSHLGLRRMPFECASTLESAETEFWTRVKENM